MLKNLYLFIFLVSCSSSQQLIHSEELRWDWRSIDTHKIYFPPNFFWGTAISEYQNSGAAHCSASNWAYFEQKNDESNNPTILNGQKSGVACNFKKLYLEDIERMKQLGINAFRFSIDWSLIEPELNRFNEDELAYYDDLCDKLIENGIMPVATLHHFNHPQWFEEKGAFEYEENIFYFVRFCLKVFLKLGQKIPMWCTINEPGIYVFQGYVRGVFPPGKCNLPLAGKVLKNLLKAHICVYKILKSTTTGKNAQIGLVHQLLQFEPYHTGNYIEQKICSYLNTIISTAVTEFFKIDTFKFDVFAPLSRFRVPQATRVRHHEDSAKITLDFIGVNYYSHVLFDIYHPTFPAIREGDVMTDMPYAIYAEGLYRAIEEVASFGVPIYITENGISDAKDDRRDLWLKRYLYAVSQALRDGYNVRGFFYWSLMDNFEWDMGYTQKFGLYEVNFETLERTLRLGARYFIDTIKRFSNNKTFWTSKTS